MSITATEIAQVIELLYRNGVNVSNSRAAYEVLKQYETNPSFALILARIFGSEACPVDPSHIPVPVCGPGVSWMQYRQLAGVTLKNNIQAAKEMLGEAAITEAARCAVQELRSATNTILVAIAAQVAVKITAVTNLSWWDSVGCNLSNIILGELVASSNPIVVLGGLYTLQYLLEDVPRQLGSASQLIVETVARMAADASRPFTIRRAAFQVATHPYELGAVMEWNVDVLSPIQEGLCNSALAFAQCCSYLLSDPTWNNPSSSGAQAQAGPGASSTSSSSSSSGSALLVLRTMLLLLDYLDYFMNLISAQDATHLVATWVGAAVHHLRHPHDRETAAAAADFLSYVFDLAERTGGEGPIAPFAAAATQNFSSIFPKLFEYIILADEEIENILANDALTYRDVGSSVVASSIGGSKRLEDEAAALDDDEAAATLRRSASSCLDKACAVSPVEAAPLVLAELGAKWGHADWRLQEAALLSFGSAVRGCYAAIAPHLAAIAPQLLATAENSAAHVCVSSMALWCLQRLASWFIRESHPQLATVLQTAAARLTASSKRVQSAAVTNLKEYFRCLANEYAAGNEASLDASVTNSIAATVDSCLASDDAYNTANLSALCDVAILVLEYLTEPNQRSFCDRLLQYRAKRMALFEQTYSQNVVQGQSTVLIDKDVMSLDRVFVAILGRFPGTMSAQHEAVLQGWASVIWDIASRGAYDDADLVYNSMFTAANLIKVMPSQQFAQWLAQRNWDLMKAALQILVHHTPPNSYIRCASCAVLFQCILSAQAPSLQDAWIVSTTYDAIKHLCASNALADNAVLFGTVAQLSQLILQVRPEEASLAVVAQVYTNLRSDAFGDSLDYHVSAAMSLTSTVKLFPQLFASLPMSVTCLIVAGAPNDIIKATATASVAHAIISNVTSLPEAQVQQVVCPVIPAFMKIVYSWQDSAAAVLVETHDGIGAVLRCLISNRLTAGALQETLRSVPDAFRNHMLSLYGVQ